tara:strand:- start:100 stop:351 length:252 start_codon:yes stop_codon:yes gene_type:complete
MYSLRLIIFFHDIGGKMLKKLLSCFIIIVILTINGCTSSSKNRGNSGQFGFWATNSSFLSKRKPSIWQCTLDKDSRYQNKNCN